MLVITGKGRAGDGVLRREVPLWFGQPPLDRLVIAYEPAAAAMVGVVRFTALARGMRDMRLGHCERCTAKKFDGCAAAQNGVQTEASL